MKELKQYILDKIEESESEIKMYLENPEIWKNTNVLCACCNERINTLHLILEWIEKKENF